MQKTKPREKTKPRGIPFTKTDPKHYRSHASGVECIEIVENFSFCIGNAVKYLWRAGIKEGEGELDDLKKAQWYVTREIERRTRALAKSKEDS